MFTMLSNEAQAKRKKMLGSIYSKSYIQKSATLNEIARKTINEDLGIKMHKWAEQGDVVDVLRESKLCLMDLTSAWLFGLGQGTSFAANSSEADLFFDIFNASGSGFFWRSEFYTATKMLSFWHQSRAAGSSPSPTRYSSVVFQVL